MDQHETGMPTTAVESFCLHSRWCRQQTLEGYELHMKK